MVKCKKNKRVIKNVLEQIKNSPFWGIVFYLQMQKLWFLRLPLMETWLAAATSPIMEEFMEKKLDSEMMFLKFSTSKERLWTRSGGALHIRIYLLSCLFFSKSIF